MSLSSKYGLPEPTIKRMLNHGVISSAEQVAHQIFDRYQQFKSLNPELSNAEIFHILAEEFKMSDSNINKNVYKVKNRI